MTKEEWIKTAAAKLEPYEGTNSRAYAESLYETFVEADESWLADPQGAVEEDMSYWED